MVECYKSFGHNAHQLNCSMILRSWVLNAATLGGISIGIDDLQIPVEKQEVLKEAKEEVSQG